MDSASSSAADINEAGQVTGTTWFLDDESGWHSDIFLWDAAHGMIDFGPGHAAAINDAGQLIGYWGDYPVQYAFLWAPDSPNGLTGSFIGAFPAADYSVAGAMNNAGQTVGIGTVMVDPETTETYAVLWDTPQHAVYLKGQLLPESDSTWLDSAAAINDSGAIAANGYNSSFQGRALLLTPVSPSLPEVRISDASAVFEGNAGTSNQPVTVVYATDNGSAKAGSDYQAATGTLTFAPGQTSKTVTVLVNGDRIVEPTETFVVNRNSPSNATIADSQAIGTILDDEPRISISDVSKKEGKKNQTTQFTFTITLAAAYDQTVTMSYSTVNGTATTGDSDYVAKTDTITFKPGETTKTITIEVKGDSKKYISDAFAEMRAKLTEGKGKYEGSDPEDADEYRAENVFWVPKEARWSHLQANAKQPTIGKVVDDAMVAIERDNARLKGVLPKEYARPGLDKHRLGELIDLIGTIVLIAAPDPNSNGKSHRSVDLLGRVYEYFLTQFASAEGKNGGQFYTPNCIVRLLVGMLAPYKGRVYDPCCGSAGMFVQSEKFVLEHGGRIGDIAIYGQESNATTRRLAIMNLAIRGIEADFGPEHADTFRRDLHKDLKANFILANPPFNDSDWHRADDDVRWKYGVPPKGNANFAWVQHFIHHLAPDGYAGFVLANGSMSSNQSGEGDIRRAIIEADLVDCMVALPGQLFYSTQIPVCLWFLAKNKHDGKRRDRRKQTLFIDARKLGTLIDRVHRELTDADIEKIVSTYHAWRGDRILPSPSGRGAGGEGVLKYADIAGFCKSATTDEITAHGHVLTPGRYVGAEEVEDDGEPFEEKMPRLVAELNAQFVESAKLEKAIKANLRGLGYGG